MNLFRRGVKCLIIVGIATTLTTTGAFADFGDILLKSGVQHDDVASAKYYLGELGYLEIETAYCNPLFDAKLVDATKSFQEDYQLKADGVIGEDTAKYILSVYNSQELLLGDLEGVLLKKEMKHEEIVTLKKIFVYLGYLEDNTICDNLYNDALFEAVKQFQKEYGLKVDGIIGQDTGKIISAVVKQQEIIKNGGVPSKINTAEILSRGGSRNEVNKASGDKIVATAKQLLGVKYVWGGSSKSGVDCSGFTTWVMGQFGVKMSRTASGQYSMGTAVDRKNMAPGDLVFFRTSRKGIGHVGIYIGNNQFIHSSTTKRKVVIESFSNYCKYSPLVGVKRINV